MAAEWRQTTVGDLCDAGVLEIQTGPFGSQLHAYDYVENGVPVVPTEAIRDRRIDRTVLPTITRSKAEELSRHRLIAGDILFARRGVQATGHVGYVRDAEQGFICGTGAIRLRVNRDKHEVLSDFLSHVFANPASVAWFKFHAIGATMPNLNEGIIRSYPLNIPPLQEQRAVADILSSLDDKIELNHRMNETLETMARALFKSWFVDFDPVRAKIEGRHDSLPAAIRKLFPNDLEASELGPIPKGWSVRPISYLAEVLGGSTPSTANAAFWESGSNCWATPKDLAPLQTPVLLETERRITDAGVQQISSGLLPTGTVLLSSRAPIGYLAIAETPTAINQGFIALVPKAGMSNLFILFWARFAKEVILSRANGSTFLEISKSNFRPIPVAVPNEQIIVAFDRTVRPLFQRMVNNARAVTTLAQIRDSLLPKFMSGDIRVPAK